MSHVILESILVKDNFFFFFFSWLLFGWCFRLLVLSTPLPYLYQFSQSTQGLDKSQQRTLKGLPFGGLDHSLKMPNCEWCSLEVSHSTFVHNTQSQRFFAVEKNTSIVMTLTHFLFCFVCCSALASQFEASNFQKWCHCANQRSARCRLHGQESLHGD